MCSFVKAHARLPIYQIYSANNFVACSAISMATATKRWVTEMFKYFATLLAAVLFVYKCGCRAYMGIYKGIDKGYTRCKGFFVLPVE